MSLQFYFFSKLCSNSQRQILPAVPNPVNHFALKASTIDGDILEKKSIDTQYYQPMVWNSALFIDSSSFTSPGKWNHRVSFASNDFGIVIWLDFIETLKIRLKAPQTWLFDAASTLSPHFNNSPNSWIDLTAFPAILPCFRYSLPAKIRAFWEVRESLQNVERRLQFKIFFQQTCKLRMLIVSTESKMASTEEVLVWTPELEVSLFHSMKGHKPVGKIFY